MLKVYLADLVYDTIKTNFTVPLNIAYLAAFAQEKLGTQVEISLFKYPVDLEKALKESAPDVLGLSYYSWNAELDLAFLKIAKEVNPKTITVMGGPNVRTDPVSIQKFLELHRSLDYYVIHEGEEPFSNLLQKLLVEPSVMPLNIPGCAHLDQGKLNYMPFDFASKPREMVQPSPYLTGLLDPFIADSNMIPLFETNRGCPFGCSYCAWGVAALSKVRQRPLADVLEEIDYVGNKSVGQTEWIFCDANFGILQRDLEISLRIKAVMDAKHFPADVTLWHSKNTGQRNIDIVKNIGGMHEGYVAIQSTDQEVLTHSGRGTMRLSEFKKVIDHYKTNGLPVSTDLLIGLPGESAASHLKSIMDAFDLGFTTINIYNIRMLPGTKYETDEWRKKFGVKTKYRPIYGSYGKYGGRRVFELEESIRETNTMSERELNDFKILHTLMGFAWNSGYFRPLLKYGQGLGVNPGYALHRLASTQNPLLQKLFDDMKKDSMSEWFDTPDEMIKHFDQEENFDKLVNSFMKLYMLYLARIFQNPETIQALKDELIQIMREELKALNSYDEKIVNKLSEVVQKTMCTDIFQDAGVSQVQMPGRVAAVLFDKPEYSIQDEMFLEVYRTKEIATFCANFFKTDKERERGLSLHSMVRFIERGGMKAFVNGVRPLGEI
jgi:radical SAM superfamily enzyme YgiQ (UPF0313 family)